MPYKSEKLKLSPEQDRRRRLTDDQKSEIRKKYESGLYSQRALAREYNVSRRTIQFTVDAEKKERARQQFKERRKDGRYKYSKEEWARVQREHRQYKQKLYVNGKLAESDTIKKQKTCENVTEK